MLKIIELFGLKILLWMRYLFFSIMFMEIDKRITINIIDFIFFVLLISLEVIDAVYINNVIIPEENVKISTKLIHLE